MNNTKVYKVRENGWTIILPFGPWNIYPGDILFFEENGVIMKTNAPVFVPCYNLTKIYYNSPVFDPNKSDDERGETRMVWKNDINLNSPNFSHNSQSWYSINEVLEGGKEWRNSGKSVSKSMGNLLEDITISWNRENKLEEIGI